MIESYNHAEKILMHIAKIKLKNINEIILIHILRLCGNIT
nr:MAG TPA: hypothetical protein [Caudoviricetes sp.]